MDMACIIFIYLYSQVKSCDTIMKGCGQVHISLSINDQSFQQTMLVLMVIFHYYVMYCTETCLVHLVDALTLIRSQTLSVTEDSVKQLYTCVCK